VFRTGWGNWDYIAQSGRNSEDMAAFVELHVEQGPILESLGKQIGIVEGIVGQRRYILTVRKSKPRRLNPYMPRCFSGCVWSSAGE